MTEENADGSQTDSEIQTSETLAQSTPSNYKILGDLSDTDATGILGRNTSGSSVTHGVWGETQSEADGSTGVHGEATNSKGRTYGVDGKTESAHSEAAGVRGSTTGDNKGVDGRVYDNESNLPTLASFESAGVFGRSDKNLGWGVVGWSINHDAVFARTEDADSYALFGLNAATDGYAVGSVGNLLVEGHADINDVGLSAYLSPDQTVPDSTWTTVAFNKTVTDDFGGYDTSTGVYTVQADGAYHVDFLIDWYSTFSSGDSISYNLLTNGSVHGGLGADTDVTGSSSPSRCFSKTLFGLSEGDTIEVEIVQNSGSSKDIFGGSAQETYLTIYKVG